MINIFEDKNKSMTEEVNIFFTLNKVWHQQITNAVESLEESIMNEPSGIKELIFDENHVVESVSQLPDCFSNNQTFSGVKRYALK